MNASKQITDYYLFNSNCNYAFALNSNSLQSMVYEKPVFKLAQ